VWLVHLTFSKHFSVGYEGTVLPIWVMGPKTTVQRGCECSVQGMQDAEVSDAQLFEPNADDPVYAIAEAADPRDGWDTYYARQLNYQERCEEFAQRHALIEFKRLCTYMYERHDGPWESPLAIAPKATKPFIRICGDYRWINEHFQGQQGPIPDVRMLLDRMQNKLYLIDIDLANAFHQIRLDLHPPLNSSTTSSVDILSHHWADLALELVSLRMHRRCQNKHQLRLQLALATRVVSLRPRPGGLLRVVVPLVLRRHLRSRHKRYAEIVKVKPLPQERRSTRST
jgi:hypothetical protein